MPDKEFTVMIGKMLSRLERRAEELSETFNRENIKQNQSEVKEDNN